jgi:hypothetical protein
MSKREKKQKRKESRKHLQQWCNLSSYEIYLINKRVQLTIINRRLNQFIDSAKRLIAKE